MSDKSADRFPEPKTFKEWAVANLCGLDFEMPVKNVTVEENIEAILANNGYLALNDGSGDFITVTDDHSKLYVDGKSVKASMAEAEDGDFIVTGSMIEIVSTAPEYGSTHTVTFMYADEKEALEPKTPIEKYLAYAVGHQNQEEEEEAHVVPGK